MDRAASAMQGGTYSEWMACCRVCVCVCVCVRYRYAGGLEDVSLFFLPRRLVQVAGRSLRFRGGRQVRWAKIKNKAACPNKGVPGSTCLAVGTLPNSGTIGAALLLPAAGTWTLRYELLSMYYRRKQQQTSVLPCTLTLVHLLGQYPVLITYWKLGPINSYLQGQTG